MDKFLAHPKDFRKIATFLPGRSPGDCVAFFYKNQKLDDFSTVRRKQQLKKRRLQADMRKQQYAPLLVAPIVAHRQRAAAQQAAGGPGGAAGVGPSGPGAGGGMGPGADGRGGGRGGRGGARSMAAGSGMHHRRPSGQDPLEGYGPGAGPLPVPGSGPQSMAHAVSAPLPVSAGRGPSGLPPGAAAVMAAPGGYQTVMAAAAVHRGNGSDGRLDALGGSPPTGPPLLPPIGGSMTVQAPSPPHHGGGSSSGWTEDDFIECYRTHGKNWEAYCRVLGMRSESAAKQYYYRNRERLGLMEPPPQAAAPQRVPLLPSADVAAAAAAAAVAAAAAAGRGGREGASEGASPQFDELGLGGLQQPVLLPVKGASMRGRRGPTRTPTAGGGSLNNGPPLHSGAGSLESSEALGRHYSTKVCSDACVPSGLRRIAGGHHPMLLLSARIGGGYGTVS